MNNIKDFIVSTINDIVYIFDKVECRYRYDNLSESHYIQIVPASIFKGSKELKNYRGQILNKFYQNFDNESIVFLTEDSLIRMDVIDLKVSGKKFHTMPAKSWLSFISDQSLSSFDQFNDSFFIEEKYCEAA